MLEMEISAHSLWDSPPRVFYESVCHEDGQVAFFLYHTFLKISILLLK